MPERIRAYVCAVSMRVCPSIARAILRRDFRQEIQASALETRRHFDVVAESLRSEIQVVAEGLSMRDEKVERFRDEVHQEFGNAHRRFLHLDARIAVLESR